QSADVMWLVHPDYPPHRIIRQSATTFVCEEVEFTDGPFNIRNVTDTAIYASAATGSITLHASAPAFTADMVGRLIRVDLKSYEGITPWEASALVDAAGASVDGNVRRYSGNVYKAIAEGPTTLA